MLKLRSTPGLVVAIGFGAFIALASVLRASPPDAVAPLLGEWSGEVSRGIGAEALAQPVSSARRYWDEGDIVRAEFIIGGEGSLRTVQIAIVPRGSRFVRIVTPDSGPVEYFVGSPAEGGVAWTPLQGVRERFVERVSGKGKTKKLELLVLDGDGWRVADTLAPATTSAFGGSLDGGASAAAAAVEPLVLPAESELALLDRLAEQVDVGVTAKANADRLARELAAAWRETEEARANAKNAETEVARARAELKSGAEVGTVRELQEQVEGARRNLKEARDWAVELENNLDATTKRSDAAATRVKDLESELASQKEAAAAAIKQAEYVEGQRQELLSRLADGEKKLQGAEAALAETERGRVAAVEAHSKSDGELATTRAALEKAESEHTALEGKVAQLTAAAGDAGKLTAELTAARAAQEQLAIDLKKQEAATAAAELAAREATQRETGSSSEVARISQSLEEMKGQLASAIAAREELAGRIESLGKKLEESEAGGVQVTKELDNLKPQLEARTTELESLRQQLAAASASGSEASATAARLTEEVATLKKARDEAMAASAEVTAAQEARRVAEAAQAESAQALATARKEAEAMRTTTVQLQKELSDLRVAADERSRDAAEARERLAEASGAGESSARERAALEADLAGARKQIEELNAARSQAIAQAETTAKGAESAREAAAQATAAVEKQLESERSTKARLEKEVEDLRVAAEARDRDMEGLQSRLASQDGSAGAAEQRVAALQKELTDIRTQLAEAVQARTKAEESAKQSAESIAGQGRDAERLGAQLAQARSRIEDLEKEASDSSARVAAVERELAAARAEAASRTAAPAADARVADLERRLADTFARAEARQAEIDRLLERVSLLDGSGSGGTRPAADGGEVARGAAVLAESEGARARTEQPTTTAAAQARAAQGGISATPASAPTSAPAGSSAPATATPAAVRASTPTAPAVTATPLPATARPAPTVSGTQAAVPATGASRVAPPTRPTGPDAAARVMPVGSREGSDPVVVQIVQRLSISGYRGSGAESVAVIDGQPYRAGQLVDVVRGVRFARVDGASAIFTGPDGAEYRRALQ